MIYLQKVVFGALIGLCLGQAGCKTTGKGSRDLLNPEPLVSDGFPSKAQPRANPVRASFNTFRR